ncbi:HTTM domain-containing protein [Maribacter sp. 2307ULW6-5]|uniref:HTTM domain-containing protein n=1 Tax=Maribacter sp. 2307ULW6-5 TaxID=3386275 RepID=UPI0039BC617A
MLERFLYTKVDNAALILFRIFFGILVALESFGAIATGWVRRNLAETQYAFPFIDFEWLRPLPGTGMYLYFAVMGLLGVFIAVGYRYRASIVAFTLLWTGVYLMQKTAYNNHYYLLVLVSLLMCFFPAHASHSVDAKKKPTLRSNTMHSYVKWIVVLQLLIVYVYASVAKLYGDWLDFGMIEILMRPRANYPVLGPLLQEPWAHKIIGTVGILFDLLIVPALLWKPTRRFAFICSIFFHLFNSVVFHIGIFPYLSLAFCVFFFEPRTLRNVFFKKSASLTDQKVQVPSYHKGFVVVLSLYFAVQFLLPLRHHVLQGDVLWTEEGHRLSWRMMLRSRQGKGTFLVVPKNSADTLVIAPGQYLTKNQQRKVFAYPDFAWQFAQFLKREHAKEGKEVSVYLKNSKVSINGRPYAPFIDSKTDLANTPWDPWRHHDWILPTPWE